MFGFWSRLGFNFWLHFVFGRRQRKGSVGFEFCTGRRFIVFHSLVCIIVIIIIVISALIIIN